MSDQTTPQDPQVPGASSDAVDAQSGATSGGFFSSTLGKIVIGVVALTLLVGIAGAAAFFFLVYSTGQAVVSEVADMASATTTMTAEASEVETATDDAEPPSQIPLSDVFTFRDIFVPTVKPTKISTSTADATSDGGSSATPAGTAPNGDTNGGTSGDGTGEVTVGEDTLFIQDIVSEDGEQVAVILFGSTEYRAVAGEQIGDSPWQVLEVGDDSVVMLYGDTQITLSVGQGITK